MIVQEICAPSFSRVAEPLSEGCRGFVMGVGGGLGGGRVGVRWVGVRCRGGGYTVMGSGWR